MTPSGLQNAIDAAWPGVESVLRATAKETAGKALDALKEAFIHQVLPANSRHLPPVGKWDDWRPCTIDGSRSVVNRLIRSYAAEAPIGLVDLAVTLDVEASVLETVALKDEKAAAVAGTQGTPTADSTAEKKADTKLGTDGAPTEGAPSPIAEATAAAPAQSPHDILDHKTDPVTAGGIIELGRAALCQQIAYVMHILTRSFESRDEGPAAGLSGVVDAAREHFDCSTTALTALVHTDSFDGLDDAERKKVMRQLAGGTLIGVPWNPLRGCALMLERKPVGTTWYTALHLQAGWDQTTEDVARIRVVSRLLLDQRQENLRRYRAPLGPDEAAPSGPDAPTHPPAGKRSAPMSTTKKRTDR